MLENKFINYIYSGVNDKLTNKPIWQEIGKDNKPIESYMISTIDNSPKIINKPNILKIKDTPEYWGAYYNVSNKFLKNPAKYNQMGIDFIESYAPTGIPAASWSGIAGWWQSTSKDEIQENIKNWEKIIKDINKHLNKERNKNAR